MDASQGLRQLSVRLRLALLCLRKLVLDPGALRSIVRLLERLDRLCELVDLLLLQVRLQVRGADGLDCGQKWSKSANFLTA